MVTEFLVNTFAIDFKYLSRSIFRKLLFEVSTVAVIFVTFSKYFINDAHRV